MFGQKQKLHQLVIIIKLYQKKHKTFCFRGIRGELKIYKIMPKIKRVGYLITILSNTCTIEGDHPFQENPRTQF